LFVLLSGVAASVLLTGCDLSAPTAPPGPTGTLTGTLQAVSGYPGGGPKALSGQIILHGSGEHITGITVGANGRFSAPVPVGTYTVSGESPQFKGGSAACHASGTLTVTKDVTTKVQVDCAN
jgi:hypothetical protein